MKNTGRYCPITDDFDLEQEIELSVDKTKKWIISIENSTDTVEQSNAILKAIATTIIDNLK